MFILVTRWTTFVFMSMLKSDMWNVNCFYWSLEHVKKRFHVYAQKYGPNLKKTGPTYCSIKVLQLGLGHVVLDVLEHQHRLQQHKHAGRGHVLRGADQLEPDERDLHGAEEADDEEGVLEGLDPLAMATHQQQDEHVQGEQVED